MRTLDFARKRAGSETRRLKPYCQLTCADSLVGNRKTPSDYDDDNDDSAQSLSLKVTKEAGPGNGKEEKEIKSFPVE